VSIKKFIIFVFFSTTFLLFGQKNIQASIMILENEEECTVGAAMGNATSDGRPVSWKNRDGSGKHFIWYVETPSGQYNYLAMGKGSKEVKMGVNEVGLSMQNSLCTGMDTGGYQYANNTAFKKYVLTKTASVAQVRQAIIQDTSGQQNHWGPPAICANFSDAHGYATHFELGGNDYFEYNPTNSKRLAQFPKQIIARANDPHKNRDHTDDASTGGARYTRARELLVQYASNNQLSIANWFRKISRDGHGTSNSTISRTTTRGVMMVHGANNGDDPKIVTAWVSLGRPDYTIFIPAWAAQKNNLSSRTTSTGDTSSFAGVSEKLYAKRDANNYDYYINDLYKPVEDNIFEVVDLARTRWFSKGFNLDEATRIHLEAAESAWQTMNSMNKGSGRNLNNPPKLTALNTSVNGSKVTFSVNASDSGGSINSYHWDFGDGNSSTTASPVHSYTSSGTYLVRARVVDNQGARNSKWKYVSVSGSGSTPTPSPSSSPTTKPGVPGDANDDGQVNIDDYVVWLNNYNQSKQGVQFGDFNENGKIDGLDYVIWLLNYGKW
jgi:hypothetical protein